LIFVSLLFENLVSEEICGRFGRFDGWTLHIGSLGFRPDDVGVSFTVWRLRYFGDDARQTE
jgi:hypothetical protein